MYFRVFAKEAEILGMTTQLYFCQKSCCNMLLANHFQQMIEHEPIFMVWFITFLLVNELRFVDGLN